MNFEKLDYLLDNGEKFGAGPARGCIIFKNHKEVYRRFCGFSDRENNIKYESNQLFYIFSCSKVLTCTAAMMLYEQGKFSFDDPIEKYIPEFKEKMVETHTSDGKILLEAAHRKPVIYDLFTMSAGLDYNLNDPHIKKAIYETNGKADTSQVIKELCKKNLVIQPGSKWNYSLCHDVLAGLIEIWSGMSFKDYITKNILLPLDMKETFVTSKTRIEERRGKLYRYDDDKKCATLCNQNNQFIFGEDYYSGGAGISSTADDYIKLAEMLCKGGKTPYGKQLIKAETIDIMRTPAYDENWQKSFIWENGFKYGMGVYVLYDPEKAGFNGGIGTFGWDGATGSYISVDTKNRISLFYMQNMFGGPIHDYRRSLLQAIYGTNEKA